MTQVILRTKGRTYGYCYIRRGSHSLCVRKNATVFANKTQALAYASRYVDIPVVATATAKPVGNPRYNRRV